MISFIIPTIGRDSLQKTLASIECWPGDEILVVGNVQQLTNYDQIDDVCVRFIQCPAGNDWGHAERNFALLLALGRYVAHIDDDDVYVEGTRNVMQDAIETAPGRPTIFRMRYPNGITLWREPKIYCGNLGTPCFLHPNEPEKFGVWGSFVGGDCHFLETSKWLADDYVWRPEVIALLGHNT